ncbi:MAG: universal stress protein [Thermomicrobiales bacterium]
MFNRIVVPLDGSAPSEEALAPAIEFARLAGATLHIIRVVDNTWLTRYGIVGLPLASGSTDEILEADRQDASDYLAAMRVRLGSTGIPVTVERREGRAADEIRSAVRPGDLLAIATHGRSGISRLALGSVAEDVTRSMETPVLLCRAHGKVHALAPDPELASADRVVAAWAF